MLIAQLFAACGLFEKIEKLASLEETQQAAGVSLAHLFELPGCFLVPSLFDESLRQYLPGGDDELVAGEEIVSDEDTDEDQHHGRDAGSEQRASAATLLFDLAAADLFEDLVGTLVMLIVLDNLGEDGFGFVVLVLLEQLRYPFALIQDHHHSWFEVILTSYFNHNLASMIL